MKKPARNSKKVSDFKKAIIDSREHILDMRERVGELLRKTVIETAESEGAFSQYSDIYFEPDYNISEPNEFMDIWVKYSEETHTEALKLIAQSFGVIEGFEMANRTLTNSLAMDEANIELEPIIELARKAASISFFKLILKSSDLDENIRDKCLDLFMTNELRSPERSSDDKMKKLINAMVKQKAEGPFPIVGR